MKCVLLGSSWSASCSADHDPSSAIAAYLRKGRASAPKAVLRHPAVLEDGVARVPPALVAIDRHERRRARCLERGEDGLVVDLEPAVAVEDPEGGAEQRQRAPQRAGGAEELRSIERERHALP